MFVKIMVTCAMHVTGHVTCILHVNNMSYNLMHVRQNVYTKYIQIGICSKSLDIKNILVH